MGQQVKGILKNNFAGMEVVLDTLPDQKITGRVVWEGFTGHDHVARQQMVRQALRDALGAEAQLVGILLTYTPREMNAMRAA